MRVLLTGFHPFAQHQTNISWQVAKSFTENVIVTDPWLQQRELKIGDLDVIYTYHFIAVKKTTIKEKIVDGEKEKKKNRGGGEFFL